MTPADIVRIFDGLDAGDVGLFMTDGGGIGAHIKGVAVRSEYTTRSLCGYGETVDEALWALWQGVKEVQPDECLLVSGAPDDRRGFTWNGITWKPYPLPPRPVPQ